MKKYASRLLAMAGWCAAVRVCVCVCMSIPHFPHFLLRYSCSCCCLCLVILYARGKLNVHFCLHSCCWMWKIESTEEKVVKVRRWKNKRWGRKRKNDAKDVAGCWIGMNDDRNCYYYYCFYYYDYDCIVCMIVCTLRLRGSFWFNSFVIFVVHSFQFFWATCETRIFGRRLLPSFSCFFSNFN